MKLLMFERPGGPPEAGVLAPGESEIIPLAGAGFSCVYSVIQGGAAALDRVRAHAAQASARVPLQGTRILAPIHRPPKFICIGLNYRDHAIESNMAIPEIPTVFNKFPNTVIGPMDKIVLPKMSAQPDYEAEFAFVIGKAGKHIKGENWRDYVFGYTNVNDVSARDIQLKGTTQWLMGKSFDTFAPMGPYIVTADEIADPHNLNVKLTLNGEVMQNSSTKELIFNIPQLLEYLSQVFTLEPGDIVSTGTPPGVGMARKPTPVFLKPGDHCVVEIEGLGQLHNPVVGE
jgi:2-keto-4-pentenoate hydratase/2-oxohepta-3-ene-1,7-dioic acid hydratase in catechol pathway